MFCLYFVFFFHLCADPFLSLLTSFSSFSSSSSSSSSVLLFCFYDFGLALSVIVFLCRKEIREAIEGYKGYTYWSCKPLLLIANLQSLIYHCFLFDFLCFFYASLLFFLKTHIFYFVQTFTGKSMSFYAFSLVVNYLDLHASSVPQYLFVFFAIFIWIRVSVAQWYFTFNCLQLVSTQHENRC